MFRINEFTLIIFLDNYRPFQFPRVYKTTRNFRLLFLPYCINEPLSPVLCYFCKDKYLFITEQSLNKIYRTASFKSNILRCHLLQIAKLPQVLVFSLPNQAADVIQSPPLRSFAPINLMVIDLSEFHGLFHSQPLLKFPKIKFIGHRTN